MVVNLVNPGQNSNLALTAPVQTLEIRSDKAIFLDVVTQIVPDNIFQSML